MSRPGGVWFKWVIDIGVSRFRTTGQCML